MINLTKESQQNIVTLKVIFKGATIKGAVEKSEGMVWQPFFGHFLCRLSFSKFNRR
ncbi:hypothetical protein [Spiroplasma endosymbiont of 'Nebria riversi']|uniref:hypothetical protein n=1 Tax=Spiroplasma endosymbiont of 'Nebria riversi' TaxID=2792084 RepID=UPI001C03D1B5|nr:hypothetical protein [Spiroplasma endosymbiont of 'Nebria riversi']